MSPRRTIAVITGTRAEFGLLRPVMRAIAAHPSLSLSVVVTGTHLLPPARTIDEIAAEFPIDAQFPMQLAGQTGRLADAAALGRGVTAFAEWLNHSSAEVVVVLGDRIEAFAAAAAASIAGVRVAHMHGGDRAEGIADEAMRHAITKLAHIHLPATALSTERIIAMGEDPFRVHLVGSPAIDGLDAIAPLGDQAFEALNRPEIVFMLHPTGGSDEAEHHTAAQVLAVASRFGRVMALHPNFDPGREGIVRAIDESGCAQRPHLHRHEFIGLLRRARLLIGNSSAGLIECAALGVRCLNVGSRQAGREMPPNVTHLRDPDNADLETAIELALNKPLGKLKHPYGDGRTGHKTAEVLASFNPQHHPLSKRNTY